MSDLHLERDFPIAPDRLFDLVSTTTGLVQWFGPEGFTVPEHALDFRREGPWFAVMAGDGRRLKVSGQVTHVRPPASVGFTWAWHDPEDKRGAESHVTLTIVATPTGARLILDPRDLATDQVEPHRGGWISTLNKLERVAGLAGHP
jgi:uncharacterized protein YndB with AHSA1/START domain